MNGLLLLATLARADETVLVLDGTLAEGGPDHVFLPFDVPEGVVEIEVRHDDLSDANILDWGLDSPDGFRGWGGGNAEPAVVGVDAASRSYLAGPIPAGTWKVVVGKAKIVETPASYAVRVTLRTQSTLAPQPERTPYVPAPALETGWRWYAGDLHVHSRESGDASPSIDAVAAEAAARGLDFVVLSDHNTTAQDDFLVDAQARAQGVLLVPGREFTTYDGHVGIFGQTGWLDHRIGSTADSVEGALDDAHAAGAFVTVNHPNLDLGDLCVGCAWEHEVDPHDLDGIEIVTGGWSPVGRLFFAQNLALWESWLDAGARIVPVGGSDDHEGGHGSGATYSPLASPTTRILARELSVEALQEGLQAGRTMVQLQGAGDPILELGAEGTLAAQGPSGANRGGAPPSATPPPPVPDTGAWTATVTGGSDVPAVGADLLWIVDGVEVARVPVTSDPFTDTRTIDAPPEGARVRLQLEVEGAPRVLTAYQWIANAPVTDATVDDGGCGCGVVSGRDGADHAPVGLAVLRAGAFALMGLRRRR